jgi:hypothetical protein
MYNIYDAACLSALLHQSAVECAAARFSLIELLVASAVSTALHCTALHGTALHGTALLGTRTTASFAYFVCGR